MKFFWTAAALALTSASTVPNPPAAIADSSARCVAITASADDRVAPLPKVSPGTPPLLSFRYYEGRLRYRFGNLDLTFDDAGH